MQIPLPDHMKIVKGALLKPKGHTDALEVPSGDCNECGRENGLQKLRCPHCEFSAHAACWVQRIGTKGSILPIEGKCPGCRTKMLWGHLVIANRPPKGAAAS